MVPLAACTSTTRADAARPRSASASAQPLGRRSCDTIPSSGASTHSSPRSVLPPSTGSAISATAEIPTKMTSTAHGRARSQAACRPAALDAHLAGQARGGLDPGGAATLASTAANSRSSHSGARAELDRVGHLRRARTSMASPTTTTAVSSTRLARPIRSTAPQPVGGDPRTFDHGHEPDRPPRPPRSRGRRRRRRPRTPRGSGRPRTRASAITIR